jgi:DNA-binding sugar fermentation-stimulating protein
VEHFHHLIIADWSCSAAMSQIHCFLNHHGAVLACCVAEFMDASTARGHKHLLQRMHLCDQLRRRMFNIECYRVEPDSKVKAYIDTCHCQFVL